MPTLPLNIKLGDDYAGATVGYSVLNLDRTVYAAYSVTGMVEVASGEFSVTDGVDVPSDGGYISILESDESTIIMEGAFDPIASGGSTIVVPGQPGVIPGETPSGVIFDIMRGDFDGTGWTDIVSEVGDIYIFSMKSLNPEQPWQETPDSQASLQVWTDGLHVLNAEDVFSTRSAEATLTVNDVDDEIALTIEKETTYELIPGYYVYDLQRTRGTAVTTVTWGTCRVLADVTRRITIS
jgi:hypothetical protein